MAAKRNTAAKTAGEKCRTKAKGGEKPVKGTTQKGTTVTSDLFRGAKAIEITKNSISVTHAESKPSKGTFEQTESRRYIPQTAKTRAAINAALEEANRTGKVKKIRVEFKK